MEKRHIERGGRKCWKYDDRIKRCMSCHWCLRMQFLNCVYTCHSCSVTVGCRTIKFEKALQPRLYLFTLSSINVIVAHSKKETSENGGGTG